MATAVFYVEFNDLLRSPATTIWEFFGDRVRTAAWMELGPMNATFAVIGSILAVVVNHYSRILNEEHRRSEWFESALSISLASLVEAGESDLLELKSSLRWDVRSKRVNRDLERTITKSVAGFMNHRGGNLVIGIDDDGRPIGIDADLRTLKHKNTDGFERALMDLISVTLGSDACSLAHCRFRQLDGDTVCHVVIERSKKPVYVRDAGSERYFVRTGNSTRELDAREAHAHISRRG